MSRRPMTKRVRRLHDMRAKWGDCYWKPGDEPHIEHECEQHEADLIEYENDVRVDFVDLLRAAPRAEALDVDALGFTDLLDVAEAILHKYPPDSIVCSHSVRADRGALTTAAIADLIASCRLSPHNREADHE